MKKLSAIFALGMALSTAAFAGTTAVNATSVSPTLQISATIQSIGNTIKTPSPVQAPVGLDVRRFFELMGQCKLKPCKFAVQPVCDCGP